VPISTETPLVCGHGRGLDARRRAQSLARAVLTRFTVRTAHAKRPTGQDRARRRPSCQPPVKLRRGQGAGGRDIRRRERRSPVGGWGQIEALLFGTIETPWPPAVEMTEEWLLCAWSIPVVPPPLILLPRPEMAL
jgi:hypothetical protein